MPAVHKAWFDKNTNVRRERDSHASRKCVLFGLPTSMSFIGSQKFGDVGVAMNQNISSGKIRENSGEDAVYGIL